MSYDEVRSTKVIPPLANFIHVGEKVYALVGGLKVHGCVALDGNYLFSLCVVEHDRNKGRNW